MTYSSEQLRELNKNLVRIAIALEKIANNLNKKEKDDSDK